MKGYIHSIETLATADGPGLRTVVFMQGCPLRCRYCHNPDALPVADSCEALSRGRGIATHCLTGKQIFVNSPVPMTPSSPVLRYTPDELYDKVIRFKEYWGDEGGVTAGGGEPLLQAAYLTEFFDKLKAAGINTALDTSGSVFNNDVKELLGFTDLIILDIKHTERKAYDNLCGVSEDTDILGKVMSFLDYCFSQKKRLWLRQVIIPGINDTKEQVLRFKQIALMYKAERAELLPYHTMGIKKWENLSMDYPLKDVPPMDEKKLNALKKL